jgi:hypothetical protein
LDFEWFPNIIFKETRELEDPSEKKTNAIRFIIRGQGPSLKDQIYRMDFKRTNLKN